MVKVTKNEWHEKFNLGVTTASSIPRISVILSRDYFTKNEVAYANTNAI